MLDFLPLASSSLGCCYQLSGGGTQAPLLIDAGIRYELIQRALNFKTTDLAGCLVSHAHGDHVKAVPDLLRSGVNCYASKETWQGMASSLGFIHGAKIFRPKPERDGEGVLQQKYGLTRVGDWTILPFEAVHDMPGTLGFYIGSPDGSKLLYLTDSAYSPFTFTGLTHICIECNFSSELLRENVEAGRVDPVRFERTQRTHMSIERLEQMLLANDLSKVEQIWLLHLSRANSDELEFKARIQNLTGKPVYIADEFALELIR